MYLQRPHRGLLQFVLAILAFGGWSAFLSHRALLAMTVITLETHGIYGLVRNRSHIGIIIKHVRDWIGLVHDPRAGSFVKTSGVQYHHEVYKRS